jgi:hypothetical protein
MKARVLTVTATATEETSNTTYTFSAEEFSNGLVTVSYENGANAFFVNRAEIEATGLDIVTEIEESEETVEWKPGELVAQWGRFVSEFSLDKDDPCKDLVRELVFSK